MATDTAVAPALFAPTAAPTDPTRHLWQLPVLVLGALAFVATWQGWLPLPGDNPVAQFKLDVAALKASYEKLSPDPAELKANLNTVAAGIDTFPDQAPLARFHLGSGYVRLAEITASPEEARGYWTLAHQHFRLVTDKQLRDPADPPKLAFRSEKARAAIGLPPDTPVAEIVLLMNILSTPQSGEDAGETQRLIAELAMRLTPPDINRAKVSLSLYVQSGIATPAASLARGRFRLSELFVETRDYDQAKKTLKEIGGDAPRDVLGPAKALLAKVLMSEANWADAAKELEQLRAVPGIPPAQRQNAAYQLGQCKQMLREDEAAAALFDEAAKGEGPVAGAAALQLANLHLRSSDQARHAVAVNLLVNAIKNVASPATYDASFVPLNEVQAAFELAVLTLLTDGAYDQALRVSEAYEKVAAPGRAREKLAEVYGKWGLALKKTPNEARPKFQLAAVEYAALVEYQPKAEGKLNMLRQSAFYSRQADEPRLAVTKLKEAVKLQGLPEQLLPTVWLELADAKLAAGDVEDLWPLLNEILAVPGFSTPMRYRLARVFVDSRHPKLVPLGRELFKQIANQNTVDRTEQEFHERSITELANALIREGNFADAESRLRGQLKLYPDGAESGLAKLLIGVCLIQRAAAPNAADAAKMRSEALALFKKIVTDCDASERRNGKLNERETWLRLQAALRVLQTHQQFRTAESARNLLFDASPMLDRYRGTIEELIILSLVYHAFKQLNDNDQALGTRARMKDAFDKLPETAFTQPQGEYSRVYWQTVWFGPEKK